MKYLYEILTGISLFCLTVVVPTLISTVIRSRSNEKNIDELKEEMKLKENKAEADKTKELLHDLENDYSREIGRLSAILDRFETIEKRIWELMGQKEDKKHEG